MALPTNFKDDVLSESMGGKRRYKLTFPDGTEQVVTMEDVTAYEQVGFNFGAGQINATNKAVNDLGVEAGSLSSSVNDVNAKVGSLSSLTTGVKTSIVNAINWLKAYATNLQNTLEARTNGKAKIWEDAEGGNVQVESPDGIKWQMDAYNGNFRVYRNENNKINPIYTFPGSATSGDVILSSRIIDTLPDVAANTTAGKVSGALAVKSLNTLVTGTRTYATLASDIGSYGSAKVKRKVWILSMANFAEPTSGIQTINVNLGVKFGVIFRLEAFAKRNNGNVYLLPYTANTDQFGTWIQATNRQSDGDRIMLKNRINWGAEYSLYVVIEYTEA